MIDRRLLAFAITACILVSACVSTHEKAWIEVSSERFKVKSALDQETTQKVAVELEQLRHAVTLLTGLGFDDPPIPTHVFLFDPASYTEFKSVKASIGTFMQRLRANWILMTTGRSREARITIQHEYIHFLLHNHEGFNYPRWYDEGFACFLSTVQTAGDKIVVGGPPLESRWLHSGSWIPIASLITKNDGVPLSQFYAESWALVHYLLWDREQKPSGAVTRYVELLGKGEDPETAFTQAFGLTPAQADRAVYALMQQLDSSVDPDKPLHVVVLEDDASDELSGRSYPTKTRPVPVAEIATDLGELALATRGEADHGEHALRYFTAAIAADPGNARAHSGAGTALAQQGKLTEAEARFANASARASADPIVELDIGEYAFKRADAAKTKLERSHWLQEARKHLIAAWKLDPDSPEAYAYYGATFTFAGETAQKGQATLEHAAQLLPSNLNIRSWLARLYLRLGRLDDAQRVLTSVVSWLHPGDPAAIEIRRVLDLIARARAQSAS